MRPRLTINNEGSKPPALRNSTFSIERLSIMNPNLGSTMKMTTNINIEELT